MSSMSNTQFRRLTPRVDVNPTDFNDFMNSSVLQNANLDPNKVAAIKDGVYGDSNKAFDPLGMNDVTDVYKTFLGFVDLKKKDAQARDEYLKAFQDMPGRNGTLTTGITANQSKQILGNGYTGVTTGASANPNKSPILGG
jgi:hypothetical protein